MFINSKPRMATEQPDARLDVLLCCKYLDVFSFNHSLNAEKLIRSVVPTAESANALA